jgi:transcriptional regulator with XRE-family HTH domain
MKPADIKALRKELRCTPREFAEALGITAKEVMAWEQEDSFPTKRFIDAMNELRDKGQSAIVKRRGRKPDAASPMRVLADPAMWELVRKLIAHPELRSKVLELAKQFDDPEN